MINAAALALAVSMVTAANAPRDHPKPPWGKGESKAEDLEIELVIFGPGPDVTGWFGHAALVVRDKALGKSRLYNYGEFSFDELMLARYAMGHLQFWVGDRGVEHTFGLYRKEGRSIVGLVLDLTPAQRLAVATRLSDNVLPENRHYIYDHFTDNCATKPRDVLDGVLEGKLRAYATTTPARMTLREHALRHTAVFLPLGWLIDFMLNDQVDQKITTWEESFLPGEMARSVRAIGVVSSEVVHQKSDRVAREEPPVMWPALLVLGVLGGGVSFALRNRPRALARWTALAGALASIPGVALFVLWAFTDHFITYRNENILLSSPLTFIAALLAAIVAVRFGRPIATRAAKACRIAWTVLAAAALIAVVIKLLPWFDQRNGPHLALFVPWTVGLAVAWLGRKLTTQVTTTMGSTESMADAPPPSSHST